MFKKALIIGLFVLCSCQPEAPRQGTLRLNLFHEPPTLDPRQTRDITSDTLILMLYEGLTRLNKKGEPTLAAAKSYSRSEDGLIYTFHLRPAVWTNGDPVTSKDFKNSWTRSPLTGRPELFSLIQAVKCPTDETLVIELLEPYLYFLHLLAAPNLAPFHDGATNGPFQLQTHQLNERLVVVKNPTYWDAANVSLPLIEMCMVDDQKTELYMYEQGELDWAGRPNSVLPLDAIHELRTSGRLCSHPVDKVYWYQFNPEVPPFNNRKVRQAFASAIDRQNIIEHVTCGSHRPAAGLLPTTSTSPLLYQPHKAKELLAAGLAELGLSQCPPIVLSLNSGEDHLRIAQAVQQQWQSALDVEVELQPTETRVHFERIAQGDYQVARFGWEAALPDSSDILDYFCRTYSLAPETTQADLLDEMLAAPLFFYTYDHLCNPLLQDIVFPSTGRVDFRWAHF